MDVGKQKHLNYEEFPTNLVLADEVLPSSNHIIIRYSLDDDNNIILNYRLADGIDKSLTVETATSIKDKLGQASELADGYLALDDFATFFGKQDALGFTPENSANKGAVDGYAPLGSDLKIASDYLPAPQVVAVAASVNLPDPGSSATLYLTLDDGMTYYWTGVAYAAISAGSVESLQIGETATTAGRGDRAKAAYEHSQLTADNPHNVTKAMVGLTNVDDTSDADKPVSTAMAEALALKVNKTTSINAKQLSGNITLNNSDIGLGSVTNHAQVKRSEMGEVNGVATLDASGYVEQQSEVSKIVNMFGPPASVVVDLASLTLVSSLASHTLIVSHSIDDGNISMNLIDNATSGDSSVDVTTVTSGFDVGDAVTIADTVASEVGEIASITNNHKTVLFYDDAAADQNVIKLISNSDSLALTSATQLMLTDGINTEYVTIDTVTAMLDPDYIELTLLTNLTNSYTAGLGVQAEWGPYNWTIGLVSVFTNSYSMAASATITTNIHAPVTHNEIDTLSIATAKESDLLFLFPESGHTINLIAGGNIVGEATIPSSGLVLQLINAEWIILNAPITSGTAISSMLFKVPTLIDNAALHFALDMFTTVDYTGSASKSFDTANAQTGVTVFDGSAWVAFPAEGVGTPYYNNKLAIDLQPTASVKYYIRYKFYRVGDLLTTPWSYTQFPALDTQLLVEDTGIADALSDGNSYVRKDAAWVSLGSFDPNATSYGNPGGTGSRNAFIIATMSNFADQGVTAVQTLIDGTIGNGFSTGDLATADNYLRFQFESALIIDELVLHLGGGTSKGTWQFQGSDDGAIWVNIGTTFAIENSGSDGFIRITTPSANTTRYLYYQLLGISGAMNGTGYMHEFEFKISR